MCVCVWMGRGGERIDCIDRLMGRVCIGQDTTGWIG